MSKAGRAAEGRGGGGVGGGVMSKQPYFSSNPFEGVLGHDSSVFSARGSVL